MTKKTTKKQFAICVSNDGSDDLQTWKIYRLLPDTAAEQDDFLRIIDESGEDYLYPAKKFVILDLAPRTVKKLLAAAK